MFESLSLFPYIAVMDSEISEQDLDALLAVKNYQRSLGFFPHTRTSHVIDQRTSYTWHDDTGKFNYIESTILNTVKSHTGHNHRIECAEELQLTRYQPGQFYDEHWDHFSHPDFPKIENDRIATVILYLNDNFTGGDTVFTRLGITVTPRRGKICYFWYPYNSDTTFLAHTGTPVEQGEKFIAQIWIRPKPWQ